jgi:hypothetical protein
MFQQPPPPVIVRVVEQPVHETSIADIIFGSLGLVGILLISAALLGLLLAGLLLLIKRMRGKDNLPTHTEHDSLRVTPLS